METTNFDFSGLPNYIEWYKCYFDPAQDKWIDGMELRNNPNWDDKQKEKWKYFYRPIKSLIGIPQKMRISAIEKTISNEKNQNQELQNTLKKDLNTKITNSNIEKTEIKKKRNLSIMISSSIFILILLFFIFTKFSSLIFLIIPLLLVYLGINLVITIT